MASVGPQQFRHRDYHQPPRVRAGRETRRRAQSLVRRHVLAQCSLGSAIEVVLKAERGFSSNFLISHREGEAIDLETTPDQVFWQTPEDDLLVHANHFISPPARVSAPRPRPSHERGLPLSRQPRTPLSPQRSRPSHAIDDSGRLPGSLRRSAWRMSRTHPRQNVLDGGNDHHGHDLTDHVGRAASLRPAQVHRVSASVGTRRPVRCGKRRLSRS